MSLSVWRQGSTGEVIGVGMPEDEEEIKIGRSLKVSGGVESALGAVDTLGVPGLPNDLCAESLFNLCSGTPNAGNSEDKVGNAFM